MLSKCLKYEWRALFKKIIPIYVVMLAASVLVALLSISNGILFAGEPTVFTVFAMIAQMLLTGGLYFLFAAVGTCVVVLIWIRFYTSFFTDEGYLTFTLPVPVDTHLTVKIISAVIFSVLTVAVSAVSLLVVTGGYSIAASVSGDLTPSYMLAIEFADVFSVMFEGIFGGNAALAVLAGLWAVTAFFSWLMTVYFSITLGTIIAKKHRVIAAIGCFIGINTANSILMEIVGFVLIIASANSQYFYAHVEYLFAIFFAIGAVFEVAKFIGFYFGTRHFLKKRLNLD